MAHATKITIATGTTAYAGDPENEDGISSREVRVEVTYQLEPGEDPSLTALLNTREVERTRRIAWQSIHDAPEPDFDPAAPGLEPPVAPAEDATLGDPRTDEDGDQRSGIDPEVPASPAPQGVWLATSHQESGVHTGSPVPNDAERVTKPQLLAIRSHFRRLGIGRMDQIAILRESFGKVSEASLIKSEAAQLMRALERGDWKAARASNGFGQLTTLH